MILIFEKIYTMFPGRIDAILYQKRTGVDFKECFCYNKI